MKKVLFVPPVVAQTLEKRGIWPFGTSKDSTDPSSKKPTPNSSEISFAGVLLRQYKGGPLFPAE